MPKTASNHRNRTHAMDEIPTDLDHKGVGEITADLKRLLADTFALYMKTKNFHWHMTGAHFRDYHLLLDEHADQIYAMTDDLAERAARLAGLRCAPSATSPAISASATATARICPPKRCSRNSARTIRR